jgi:hypothetical protein
MPKLDAIVRLIGAIPLEWNDEFAVRRASSMTLETLAPLRNEEIVGLPAAAAYRQGRRLRSRRSCRYSRTTPWDTIRRARGFLVAGSRNTRTVCKMMQRSLLSKRPPSRRDPSIELRYELTKEP